MLSITAFERNSQRLVVRYSLRGNPGEAVDCEGVDFGEYQLEFPPSATLADIAARVRTESVIEYTMRYTDWVSRQQLAALLSGGA